MTIGNSIVAGNQAGGEGDDIYGYTNSGLVLDLATIGANIIGTGPSGAFTGGLGAGDTVLDSTPFDLEDVFAVVTTADPDGVPNSGDEFPAGAIDNNGGAAAGAPDTAEAGQTAALVADGGNPAVNAGDPTIPLNVTLDEAARGVDINGDNDTDDIIDDLSDVAFDQRGDGFARNPTQPGGAPDLGAFEVQEATMADDPSILVTTTADVVDDTDGVTSLREAIGFVNGGTFAPGSTITFADAVAGGVINLTGGELTLNVGMTIDGGDQGVTIDADPDPTTAGNQADSRIFLIEGAAGPFDGDVTLANLEMINGMPAAGESGGAILAQFDGVLTVEDSAVRDSTARFGGGIYSDTGNELVLDGVEITGNTAASPINFAVNGGGVYLAAATATITDTLFSDNSARSGGAVFIDGSSEAALIDTTITNNQADADGGGVYAFGNVALTRSTVSDNVAGDTGGGISAYGAATLTETIVSDNDAGFGGGVFSLTSLTLDQVTMSGNTAEVGGGIFNGGTLDGRSVNLSSNAASGSGAVGGALFGAGGSDVTLVDAVVADNTADGDGGAFDFDGGGISLTLVNAFVSGNASLDDGGAIDGAPNIDITLVNTTLTDNSAADLGGAIRSSNGATITLAQSTVSGNAAVVGGAIFADVDSTATLTNSIIAGNQASITGDDLAAEAVEPMTAQAVATLQTDGGVILDSAPVDFDESAGPTFTMIDGADQSDLESVADAVGAAPTTGVASMLSAANAGPEVGAPGQTATLETVALRADLTNPALDGGTGALPTETELGVDADGDGVVENAPISVDARGFPRDVDQPGGGTPDIGAFEAAMVMVMVDDPSLVVTTLLDVVDASDGVTSLREAIGFVNDGTFAPGSTIEFDPTTFADGGTINLTQGQLQITEALVIAGVDGLTVSADPNLDNDDNPDTGVGASGRVFFISTLSPDFIDVTIENLRIADGFLEQPDGGGGGGVRSRENLTLRNVVIENNTVTGDDNLLDGGGLEHGSAALVIEDSVIRNNSAINPTFSEGGGVHIASGTAQIVRTLITGNETGGQFARGGGVNSSSGAENALQIIDSTIAGNQTVGAQASGGGVSIQSFSFGSAGRIVNSTISGNAVGEGAYGSGVYVLRGTLGIYNSTIADNTAADGVGAGVASGDVGAQVALTSTIVADNNGGDVDAVTTTVSGAPSGSAFASGGNNLIGAGDAAGAFNAAGDIVLGADDAGLAPLADNGGGVLTHALMDGSPARDAGANPLSLQNDQRGDGFPREVGDAPDIGAFELQETAADPASVGGRVYLDANGDGAFDAADGDVGLSGVEVSLSGPLIGDAISTAFTDGDGFYTFGDVPTGVGLFVFVDPNNPDIASRIQTEDPDDIADGGTFIPSLVDGEDLAEVDFGYADVPPLELTLVFDQSSVDEGGALNGAVTRNGSEGALEVLLLSSDTGEAAFDAASTTIPDGETSVPVTLFGVQDLEVDGDQIVTIAAQENAVDGASSEVQVTVVDVVEPNVVEGVVFDDANGDGARDADENGIAGIAVTLTLEGETLPAFTTITDGDGGYRFDQFDVVDGMVFIEVAAVPGAIQTADPDNAIDRNAIIQFSAPGTTATADFGFQLGALGQVISLGFDPAAIAEGGASTATITRDATVGALEVEIDVADTSQIQAPALVTIPDGASFTTFQVVAIDDDIVESDETVQITAAGAGGPSVSSGIAIADDDADQFDLQITEIWPGAAGVPDLTEDWFEITNIGAEAWVSGVDPDLFYDDLSQDPTVADLISGIDAIEPGESAIVVIGDASDVADFEALWSKVIDLADTPVGFADGSGLAQGGDGVALFVGAPMESSTPADFETFPDAAMFAGRSYDVERAAFSVAGQDGAVATLAQNPAGDPAVGSPGNGAPIAPTTISVSIASPNLNEGDDGAEDGASFIFAAEATNLTEFVSARIVLSPGEADAADFVLPIDTLRLVNFDPVVNPSGIVPFNIDVLGDLALEDDETFSVSLVVETGDAAFVGGPASATILNDDDETSNVPPVAVDLDLDQFRAGSIATLSVEDVVAELGFDLDDTLLASSFSFDSAEFNGQAFNAPAALGFSFTPGAGVDGTIEIDASAAPYLGLADGELGDVTVFYTVDDGQDTDTGALTFEIVGGVDPREIDIAFLGDPLAGEVLTADVDSQAGQSLIDLEASTVFSLEVFMEAFDFTFPDAIFTQINTGALTYALALANDGGVASAEASDGSISTAIANFAGSTADAVSTNNAFATASSFEGGDATADADNGGDAVANAIFETTATASADAGTIADAFSIELNGVAGQPIDLTPFDFPLVTTANATTQTQTIQFSGLPEGSVIGGQTVGDDGIATFVGAFPDDLTLTVPPTFSGQFDLAAEAILSDGAPDEAVARAFASQSVAIDSVVAPATVFFDQPAFSAEEGDPGETSSIEITLRRTGPTDQSATVQVQLLENAAVAEDARIGDDDIVEAIGDTLDATFAMGSETATVTIDVVGDDVFEVDESLILSILQDGDIAPGEPQSAAVTIVNDDPAGLAPIANDIELGSLGLGADLVIDTFDIVFELASDPDSDLDADDIVFTDATIDGQIVSLTDIGFSYEPGLGDDAVIKLLTEQAIENADPLVIASADGSAEVVLNFTVTDETNLSDDGTVTFTVEDDGVLGGEGFDIGLSFLTDDPNATATASAQIDAFVQAGDEAAPTQQQITVVGPTSLVEIFASLGGDAPTTPDVLPDGVSVAVATAMDDGDAMASASGGSVADADATGGSTATASATASSLAGARADVGSTAEAIAAGGSSAVARAFQTAAATAAAEDDGQASAEAIGGADASAETTAGLAGTFASGAGTAAEAISNDASGVAGEPIDLSGLVDVDAISADGDVQEIVFSGLPEGSVIAGATAGADGVATVAGPLPDILSVTVPVDFVGTFELTARAVLPDTTEVGVNGGAIAIQNVTVSPGAGPTPPVINEFSIDGGPVGDFIEIFGDPETDYSMCWLVALEGDADAALSGGPGLVLFAEVLPTTDAAGFGLVDLGGADFDIGSTTFLIIDNYTFDGVLLGDAFSTDFDVDDDGAIDPFYANLFNIVDDVAVLDDDADFAYAGTVLDGDFDQAVYSGAASGEAPVAASRIPNGTDADAATDWRRNERDGVAEDGEALDTPGAENATIPVLTFSIDPASIFENGGEATATVTRAGQTSGDLVVTLSSSDATEAIVPATVTIQDGFDSASFTVSAVNDALLDGVQTATFAASATGFVAATAALDVLDDDVAPSTLSLAIDPASISENGGVAVGTVTLDAPALADLTVTLASDDATEATVPASVVILAEETSATFAIAAVDDPVLDGPQTAAITASATGFADATATLDVTDDEVAPTPTLTLSIDPDAVSENGGTATATVTRNTGTSGELVVTLSSSDATEATVPATVTIQDGFDSASFTVSAVDDALLDGAQTPTITASATGFVAATAALDVLDDETPPSTLEFDIVAIDTRTDLAIATLNDGDVINADLFAGRQVTFAATVRGENGDAVESVALDLNDGAFTRVESVDPYALFGDDTRGDFFGGERFDPGQFSLRLAAFSEDGAGGDFIGEETLRFAIADDDDQGGDRNEAPIARDDQARTKVGEHVSIDVLDNDRDPDDDDIEILSLTQPSHGAARIEDGEIVYTPDPGFVGTDAFSYRITDGSATDDARVRVHVEEAPATGGSGLVLRIVDTETNEIGRVLSDNDTIDLAQEGVSLGSLGFAFFGGGDAVESVRLEAIQSGATIENRVENVEPYALFGDTNGDFASAAGASFTMGGATLTAHAFDQDGGGGRLVDRFEFDLTIADLLLET